MKGEGGEEKGELFKIYGAQFKTYGALFKGFGEMNNDSWCKVVSLSHLLVSRFAEILA